MRRARSSKRERSCCWCRSGRCSTAARSAEDPADVEADGRLATLELIVILEAVLVAVVAPHLEAAIEMLRDLVLHGGRAFVERLAHTGARAAVVLEPLPAERHRE